jgi:hypothetical protein
MVFSCLLCLLGRGSVYTVLNFDQVCIYHGVCCEDQSPSGYLYAVAPRNVLFAQRRVARLNLTQHAAATAICSRGSKGGGGCGTAAEGHGLGSGSLQAGSGVRSVCGVQ